MNNFDSDEPIPVQPSGMSFLASELLKRYAKPKIWIIDVGRASAGVIDFVGKAAS